MTKEEQKSLFQKFKIVERTKSMNSNGLGLGLYLSKEIALKLGGDVFCESTLNEGSTFTIEFALDHINEIKEIINGKSDYSFENTILKFKKKASYQEKKKEKNRTIIEEVESDNNSDIFEESNIVMFPYDFGKSSTINTESTF